MESKGIFSCDIDGVLADPHPLAIEVARREFGVGNFAMEDWKEFETLNDCVRRIYPQMNNEEITLKLFGRETIENAQPMAGSIESLRVLRDKFEIRAVTSRPAQQQRITREWVGDYFGDLIKQVAVRNHFMEVSGREFKRQVLLSNRASIHVEDDAQTVRLLCELPDLQVMMMRRPWNSLENGGYERVDWSDVLERVMR